jgi:hypothetical protein
MGNTQFVGARVERSGGEGLDGRPPPPERVDRRNGDAQHRREYSRVDPRGQPGGGRALMVARPEYSRVDPRGQPGGGRAFKVARRPLQDGDP